MQQQCLKQYKHFLCILCIEDRQNELNMSHRTPLRRAFLADLKKTLSQRHDQVAYVWSNYRLYYQNCRIKPSFMSDDDDDSYLWGKTLPLNWWRIDYGVKIDDVLQPYPEDYDEHEKIKVIDEKSGYEFNESKEFYKEWLRWYNIKGRSKAKTKGQLKALYFKN